MEKASIEDCHEQNLSSTVFYENFYKITFVSKTSVEKIHFLGHLWKYSILKVLMEKCRGIKKWKHLLPSFEYISINLSNRNPPIRPSFIYFHGQVFFFCLTQNAVPNSTDSLWIYLVKDSA